MRYALRILDFLLLGAGIVWFLQGINILPGSFMTGNRSEWTRWVYRGGGTTAVAGLAILFLAGRFNKRS